MIQLSGSGIVSSSGPSALPSIWGWYEPSREVGLSNGNGIPTLTDQTGNGRNWTNASAPPGVGTQPIYDTADALNGLAVAEMNGSHYWAGPDLTGLGVGTGAGKESHVFLVVRSAVDSGAINGLWDLSGCSNGSLYPYSDGNLYDSGMKGTRESIGSPGVTLIAWRVYEIAMKASLSGGATNGHWELKIDGTSKFSTNIVGASPSAAPVLGRNVSSGYSNLRIAGFYIFSADLTGTGTRTDMIDYINTRFGLSSS